VNDPSHRLPLADAADLIAVGQPLPFKVIDGHGRLLLAAGQKIIDERQIGALFERGASVEYAEVEVLRRTRQRGSAAAAAHASAVRETTLFDRWERHLWALDTVLRGVAHHSAQRAEIETLAAEHIALVDRDADAALFLCVRQDDRRLALYGLTHALHTATVLLLSGRLLGWAPARLQTLVCAALTMNVSIIELQARMAAQTDPPTKRQLDEIRAHPAASTRLLEGSGVDDAEWLQAVDEHHELPGGGGYPRQLQQPCEAARLLRVADVFMAKISPRALRPPMLPQLAARQLFQEESGGVLAAAVIKAVGVYPPGDFARLRNGDVAVVMRRATPKTGVLTMGVLDAHGRPLVKAPKRDAGEPEFAITGPVLDRAGLPRVLPEQVYGLLAP
jgi:hypothetical protein